MDIKLNLEIPELNIEFYAESEELNQIDVENKYSIDDIIGNKVKEMFRSPVTDSIEHVSGAIRPFKVYGFARKNIKQESVVMDELGKATRELIDIPWELDKAELIVNNLSKILSDQTKFKPVVCLGVGKSHMTERFNSTLAYLWDKEHHNMLRNIAEPSPMEVSEDRVSFYSLSKDDEDLEHTTITSLIASRISDTVWNDSSENTIERFADVFSPLTVYGFERRVAKHGFGDAAIDGMLADFEEDYWEEEYGGEDSPPWSEELFKAVEDKLYEAMNECIGMAHVYQCDLICSTVLTRDDLLDIMKEIFSDSKTKFKLENHYLPRPETLLGFPNDTVAHAMRSACIRYGGKGKVFNSVCFSSVFCNLTGIAGPIDGIVVRAIMNGRSDVLFDDKRDNYYTWLGE